MLLLKALASLYCSSWLASGEFRVASLQLGQAFALRCSASARNPARLIFTMIDLVMFIIFSRLIHSIEHPIDHNTSNRNIKPDGESNAGQPHVFGKIIFNTMIGSN